MKASLNHDELGKQSFHLLSKIGDESFALKSEKHYREAFVYRHTRNIHQLGADVVHLLAVECPASCPIIIRAMLESLFKLCGAVNQANVAVEILLSEVEEDMARIKKWLDPILCEPAIKIYEDFSKRLRTEYQITSNKKWNTIACAEAAKLSEKYRRDYFYFSAHAHATSGGLILQEMRAHRGYVFQTLLFIVLCAAGHAPQAIPTKTPQKHVDEAARLINELVLLMEEGVFDELNQISEIETD